VKARRTLWKTAFQFKKVWRMIHPAKFQQSSEPSLGEQTANQKSSAITVENPKKTNAALDQPSRAASFVDLQACHPAA
jgi:hypothetical protein